MIISSRQTVTTVPVSIVQAESIDSIVGQTVVIKNLDYTNSVYVGGADVTIQNGYVISPGAQLSWREIR